MIRYSLIAAVGMIWLSNSIAQSAYELANASFESPLAADDVIVGWDIREYGHTVERDFQTKQEGEASLKVMSGVNPQTTVVRQEIPSALIQERAYALSGHVKTEELHGAAWLTVIINRLGGRRYVDWMRDRSATGSTEWTILRLNIPRFSDAESFFVGVGVSGSGTDWFDALDLTPIQPNNAPSAEASRYLEAALDIMQQHSINREQVDWESLRREARIAASGTSTAEETYPAIGFALHMLGDNHSALLRPDDASKLFSAESESSEIPKWNPSQGLLLFNRFGYVTVPAFQGLNPNRLTRYANELQDVIEKLDSKDVCGWIVDLRQNTGGNVFPMIAGIGPILGEGSAGGGINANGEKFLKSYTNGSSGRAAVSRVPYTLINSVPPVAVLIGPSTGSSGEAVTVAFIGRLETKTFGQPSAGVTTGNSGFPLEDGAILFLAVTTMIDRTGRLYGGKIEPDVAICGDQSQDPLTDETVLAAVDWLKTKCD